MSVDKNEIKLSLHIDKQKVRNQKYFIYKGKKYPFDFDLLVKNSNYFFRNREQFENVEYIDLMASDEEGIDIPEESIEAFISCCQNEPCEVTIKTVIPLQYLSYKYEYPEIISNTENFCQEYKEKIIFESLLFKTKITNKNEEKIFFDTTKEEEIISNNFDKYMNNDKMIELPIPILERIIQANNNNTKDKINKEMINFLFKILDKKGKDCSILFNNIDFREENICVINRLLNEYSDKFDFNMINSTLLKTTTELTSEIVKEQEKYQEIFKEMKQYIEEEKTEIKRMKEEEKQRREEEAKRIQKIKEKYEEEIKIMKKDNEERIKNIELKFERMIKNYDKIISKGNLEQFKQITIDMMTISEFEKLNKESKQYIIEEIITNENNFNNQHNNNNNNELKRHILTCNRLFNILSTEDADKEEEKKEEEEDKKSKIKPLFNNDQETRMNFIIDNIKEIDFKYDIIEYLYNKNIIDKYIIDINENFHKLTLQIHYPTKSFDKIIEIIDNIKNQYSSQQDIDINININISIIKTEEKNQFQILQLEKNINHIITARYFPKFISSICDKINSGKENSLVFEKGIWLTQISIPSSVTSIRYSAFNGCSSLTQITIPSSVTSIGNNAFYRCSSLTQITIPSSVTKIGVETFYECSKLTQISIPSSVTEIGQRAFYYCSSLAQISIPSSLTKIEDETFRNCRSLTQISIPSSITEIKSYAFCECSSLAQISFEIPSSVASIRNHAFCQCTSLTQISIPSSVTYIEYFAFENCTSLIEISFPSSLTNIGSRSLSGCSSLVKISISPSVNLESLGVYQ